MSDPDEIFYAYDKVLDCWIGEDGWVDYLVHWVGQDSVTGHDVGNGITQDLPQSDRDKFDSTMQQRFPRPTYGTEVDPWVPLAYEIEQMSCSNVVRTLWKWSEEANNNIFRTYRNDPQSFLGNAMTILLTMSVARLCDMLCDGITRSKVRRSRFARKLTDMGREERPCIYVIELCDKYGGAPSYATMKTALEIALDEKQQWYKDWVGDTRGRKDSLKVLYNNFLRITAHLSPGEWQQPCKVPFRDVGYSKDGERRLRQHMADKSSNWLMHMIKGIVQDITDSGDGSPYQLYGDTIFDCYMKFQAAFGEEFFDLALGSNIASGRGFNTHPAGMSVASSENYDDLWLEWFYDVTLQEDFAKNKDIERGRRAAVRQRGIELQQRIDMLEAEAAAREARSREITALVERLQREG